MTEEKVLFDVVDGVGAITLNRPDKANAMDLEVMETLMRLAITCDESSDIRAVVITGAGKFFSAGGDMASFQDAGDNAGALVKEMTTHYHAAISRFSRMDAPIIAAVNGMAAGAGFSLAAACDLSIAAQSAQFLSAYTAGARSPDGSSTYFLPRLIGTRRAMELFLTNRRLSAQEALAWGLINRVVADEDLMGETMALARELADGPTLAHGVVKSLMHRSLSGTLETQMELESRGIAAMSHTEDAKEGAAAFLEKRSPNYKGR